MTKKFYLEKVILILLDIGDEVRFWPLMQNMRGLGIRVEVLEEGTLPDSLQQDTLQPEELHTLYITDSGTRALYFQERGMPVLGWWHENVQKSVKTRHNAENPDGKKPARKEPYAENADREMLRQIRYVVESPEELEAEYPERVYRRFCNIPWDILETERCLVRETMEEDVDSFFTIYQNPEIVRYTEALYPEIEQEKQYVREYIEKVYGYFEFGVWTVLWKETGEIIGRAGFSVREGYELPELGFVIGLPWQGKGVAYEICQAILCYGWEEYGFDRVQALVRPHNAASAALCRKLGFTKQNIVYEGDKEHVLFLYEK